MERQLAQSPPASRIAVAGRQSRRCPLPSGNETDGRQVSRYGNRGSGLSGAFTGQKTYNGVAILSKKPVTDIVKNNPLFPDEQQRIVAATVDNIRIVCAYVPNGQAVGSEKYSYKLDWLRSLTQWLAEERQKHPYLALLGDYNIAPEDRDVYEPGGMGRQRSRFATGTGCFPGIAGHRFHRRLPSFRTA